MTFDSLEDRRLLAGLNVFVYDDADRSGVWESSSENPIAEQVVFVDNNNDGRLGANEPYGIAGADGKAFLDNLASGIAILRILGSSSPATLVSLGNSSSPADVNLAGNPSSGNIAPVLGAIPAQSVDEDNSMALGLSLLESAASDADNDPLWYFVVGRPSNGILMWSVEAGGAYQPNENFYGTDAIQIRAFDGKAWSAESTLDLTVNSVDDLPTAIEFAGGSIPENHAGFVIGAVTIVDVDGGPNSIQVTPEDLYEVQDGKLRLVGGVSLNFEERSSSELTLYVTVGASETPTVSRAFSLPVDDRNDAPRSLEFQGQLRVEEFIAGYEFGSVQVIDEDVADQYEFRVSDDRFEVVDGKLALKAGVYLVFVDAPSVSVTITAVSQTSGDTIRETLSIEVVRAAPPWQNKNSALDVNNDGELTPLDVLMVINALNRMGVSPLDRLPPPGSAMFVDVNGDRYLTPLDALILINALNRQSRGSSEGNPGGPQGPSNPGGGVGEGEGKLQGQVQSAPSPAPQQTAGDFQRVDRTPRTVGNQSESAAVDDEQLAPPHLRRTARRVR